jgi:hypothetical protein
MKKIFLAFALVLAACRHDPTAQKAIDALPTDDPTPNDLHRPGEPCLACHSTYQGATPAFAVAGTVFSIDAAGNLSPAAHVRVTIADSAADLPKTPCTNAAGNFYVKKEDWADIAFPLKVRGCGGRSMQSLIGRDGSCGSCHKLPSDASIDKNTGAAHDSPGVILVDAMTSVDATCP